MKKYLFGGSGTGNPAGDAALTVLRIATGFLMIYLHGWKKLQDPSDIIKGVTDMNFPIPTVMGWSAILAETFFSLLLILGLATRFSALMLMATMFTAALVVHAADPVSKKELALIYAFICLLFLVIGAGRFSVDRLISNGK